MITEDYVSFETAKLLKEKGFDEPVYRGISINNLIFDKKEPEDFNHKLSAYCSQPTLQMAMKWLREVHKIVIVIQPLSFNGAKDCLCDNWTYSVWVGYNLKMGESLGIQKAYFTYEEACEAAIKFGMFFVDNKNRI